MRKKYAIIGAIAIGLATVLACGIIILSLPGYQIDPSTFREINIGMPERDVVQLLGKKPDLEYDPKEVYPFLVTKDKNLVPASEKMWKSSKWTIIVQFDDKGKVIAKAITKSKDLP